MFDRLRIESEELIKDLIQLIYYMRGAVQYTDMLNRTPAERGLIREFVKARLEAEQNKVYQVY